MNPFRPLGFALALSVAVAAAAASANPAATLRELQQERTQRTREATPDYKRIDADIAAKAAAAVSGVDPSTVELAQARSLAGLFTLAEQHDKARTLLKRLLATTLSDDARLQAEMDYMMACVRLNDGEEVYRTLKAMRIEPSFAANLGSFFGGTYHHYVFNARGAKGCLEIIDRIEPLIPDGPFANDEARKSNGWARRQIAAAKALYLSESGRRDEAVAVLDRALETLDHDIFRREGLRGDRQRYLLLGLPAPQIAVDRTHGAFAGVEAYRGKVLILEFTAHWCHACHAAIPALKQLYADMKERGFEMVSLTTYYGFFGAAKGIGKDDEYARMPAMLKEQGVTWPMVYTDRATMTAFGVTGIPQIMLLDKQGRIRKIDLGFSEAKMQRFKDEIATLLAE